MIKNKKKHCRGKGKASGYPGCGKITHIFKYGLCKKCFFDWLNNTSEGNNVQQKQRLSLKKNDGQKNLRFKIKPVSNKRKEQLKVYSTKGKKELEEIKSNRIKCYIGGEEIPKQNAERHHLHGRENQQLYKDYVWTCRTHHKMLHQIPFILLLKEPWYQPYLSRLKKDHPKAWRKEIYRRVKSNFMTNEEYLQKLKKAGM